MWSSASTGHTFCWQHCNVLQSYRPSACALLASRQKPLRKELSTALQTGKVAVSSSLPVAAGNSRERGNPKAVPTIYRGSLTCRANNAHSDIQTPDIGEDLRYYQVRAIILHGTTLLY